MTEKLSVNYELLEIFQFQEAQLDKKLRMYLHVYTKSEVEYIHL